MGILIIVRNIFHIYLCVIFYLVRQFNDEEDQKIVGENLRYPKPHKHDVISCLGASGKWITQQPSLQVQDAINYIFYMYIK